MFRFSQSLYITSEDFPAISICLGLVDGRLATNITVELVQGTADVMATRKQNVTLLSPVGSYCTFRCTGVYELPECLDGSYTPDNKCSKVVSTDGVQVVYFTI